VQAKIIDGNEISREIRKKMARGVKSLKEKTGITPGLAAVLVGGDPASAIYVQRKGKAAREVGIYTQTFRLPSDVNEMEVLSLIERLNQDPLFHGILVQLPLPPHLSEGKIIQSVLPTKDVDGLHPENMGKLLLGTPLFIPCTPAGIHQMLLRSGYNPEGKHVAICSRSNIVGKPLMMTLMQKREGANSTVTLCHTGTRDFASITSQADILVAAVGMPEVITADSVKEGAVVIDVGINRVKDPSRKAGYRLVGDVDFEGVKDKIEAITPVPGGVGPMTVTMLLVNTLKAAQLYDLETYHPLMFEAIEGQYEP